MKRPNSIYFTLVFVALFVQSCITDKYDFDQDTSLGLSFSEEGFCLAGPSDLDIPMSQILQLSDSSELTVDPQTGNYLFYKSKTDMDTTTLFIAHGSLCDGTEDFSDYSLHQNPTVTFTPSTRFPAFGTLRFESAITPSYAPDALTTSIRELRYIQTDLYVTIDMAFDGIQGFEYIDEIRYLLPSFYVVEHPEDLTERHISVSQSHTHRIHVIGVDFRQEHLLPNERAGIDPQTHRIILQGDVRVQGLVKMAHQADFLQAAAPTIHYRVNIGTMITLSVTGRFDQRETVDVDPIDFSHLPKFLKDEEVTIDLENPVLRLSLYNELPAEITMHGQFSSMRQGEQLYQLSMGSDYQQPAISFPGPAFGEPAMSSTIWISREPIAQLPDTVTQNVVLPEIMNLVSRMPDQIVAKIYARTDSSQVRTISLSKRYKVAPKYELVAPLKIGRDMKIVYSKDIKQLKDALQHTDVSEMLMTAQAHNRIPLDLSFKVEAYDADHHLIEGFIYDLPEAGSPIAGARGEGVVPAGTSQEVTFSIRTNGNRQLFRQIDYLRVKIYGQSSPTLEGQYLNRNQNVRLSDICFILKTTSD